MSLWALALRLREMIKGQNKNTDRRYRIVLFFQPLSRPVADERRLYKLTDRQAIHNRGTASEAPDDYASECRNRLFYLPLRPPRGRRQRPACRPRRAKESAVASTARRHLLAAVS